MKIKKKLIVQLKNILFQKLFNEMKYEDEFNVESLSLSDKCKYMRQSLLNLLCIKLNLSNFVTKFINCLHVLSWQQQIENMSAKIINLLTPFLHSYSMSYIYNVKFLQLYHKSCVKLIECRLFVNLKH